MRKSRRLTFADSFAESSRPDISDLFLHYDKLYFSKRLKPCTTIEWTSRRNAGLGICDYQDGSCRIQLSEPKLKRETEADMKNVLLHHMIHAFLLSTDEDHNDHGVAFTEKMHEINSSKVPDTERPQTGYQISEVLSLPHWMCGECGQTLLGAECALKACEGSRCPWHMHIRRCEGSYQLQRDTCVRSGRPRGKNQASGKTSTKRKLETPATPEVRKKEPRIDKFFEKAKAKAPAVVPHFKAPAVVPLVTANRGNSARQQRANDTLSPTIIAWKGWWALEREEDDIVEKLIDRRRERRLEEIARQNVMQLAEECEKVQVGAISLDGVALETGDRMDIDEVQVQQASKRPASEARMDSPIHRRTQLPESKKLKLEDKQIVSLEPEDKQIISLKPEDKQLVVLEQDKQMIVLDPENKQLMVLETEDNRQLMVLEPEDSKQLVVLEPEDNRPTKLRCFSRRDRKKQLEQQMQMQQARVECSASAAAAIVPVIAAYSTTKCPVCSKIFPLDPNKLEDNARFNTHVDNCLSKVYIDRE